MKTIGKIRGDANGQSRAGKIVMEGGNLLKQSKGKDENPIPKRFLLSYDVSGIPFGDNPDEYPGKYIGMRRKEEGNIIVIGGNGSGKSVGIVKPSLALWKGPLFAIDIKGELSDYYRELYKYKVVNRPCIVFDFMKTDGPGYDPLWWLTRDSPENLFNNIKEIAEIIIPNEPEIKEPFWQESERALLEAALLYYYKLGLSFSEIICVILSQKLSNLCQVLEKSKDPLVKMLLGELSDMKDETRASIDRGLRNKIVLFATDPYISHTFRGMKEGANSFTWGDLDEYNIFLCIPADKIEQWDRAIRLMCTQLIRHLERRPEKYSAEGKDHAQTLLVMDEFARLGKMEMITASLATLRSKKVNFLLVVQSIAQLDKIYGVYERRIILDNCQFQAILRSNDAETQKYLSDLIGTRICMQNSVSESLNRNLQPTGYSKNVSEIRDFAVCPHELSALTDVLLLTPYGFCRVKKLQAYDLSDIVSDDPPVIKRGYICRPQLRFMENEGAQVLTVEERVANARRRVKEALAQQRMAVGPGQAAQMEDDEHFCRDVGKLLLQWFPDIWDLEAMAQAGNANWLRPLSDLLEGLSADQVLVEDIKRKFGWTDFDGSPMCKWTYTSNEESCKG